MNDLTKTESLAIKIVDKQIEDIVIAGLLQVKINKYTKPGEWLNDLSFEDRWSLRQFRSEIYQIRTDIVQSQIECCQIYQQENFNRS